MKNAVIVVATSLALVTGAMGVELVRRQSPAAEPAAPVPVKEARADPAPLADPFPAPAESEAEDTAYRAVVFPADVLAAAQPAPSVEAPAAAPAEVAAIDAAPSPVPPSHIQPSYAAPAPVAARAAEPKPVAEAKPVAEPDPAPLAAAPEPPRRKAVEKAGKPAPRKAFEPQRARQTRLAAEASGREPRGEIYAARWPVAPAAQPGAAPLRFSGSFGGCRYRGVVTPDGYRIESSC